MGDEHNCDETCYVRFNWAYPDENNVLHVVAWLGDAKLHVDFKNNGEGAAELGRIVVSMPKILGHIRDELMIKREVDEVDQDLLDLLGEGEV